MFPIRDHNPSGRTPFVTYALIAANIVVFLSYALTAQGDAALGQVYYTWGLIPAGVMQGQGLHTVFTSMFIHGGWMHIAGNLLFLWIYGDNLEDEMGHIPYLAFYLICGLAAAALQIAADPTSGVPMVGASGAIAGVMGGYLLLFPKARIDVVVILVIIVKVFQLPAWLILGFWFGIQIFSGAMTPTDGGGVAYMAHIGGFIAGVVLAFPVWMRRGGFGFWRVNHGAPPHPEATYPMAKSRIPSVPRGK